MFLILHNEHKAQFIGESEAKKLDEYEQPQRPPTSPELQVTAVQLPFFLFIYLIIFWPRAADHEASASPLWINDEAVAKTRSA